MANSPPDAFIADVHELEMLDMALLDIDAQSVVTEELARLLDVATGLDLSPAVARRLVLAAGKLGARADPMKLGLLGLAKYQTQPVAATNAAARAIPLEHFV